MFLWLLAVPFACFVFHSVSILHKLSSSSLCFITGYILCIYIFVKQTGLRKNYDVIIFSYCTCYWFMGSSNLVKSMIQASNIFQLKQALKFALVLLVQSKHFLNVHENYCVKELDVQII